MGRTLYVTTEYGGAYNGGMVFSITTGRTDGANSNAGLLDVAGVLYGTTTLGGSASQCHHPGGRGTVFALTP